jgi:predicted transcriptional regulator
MGEWVSPLRQSLRMAISGMSDPDEIVDTVMMILSRANVVSYSDSAAKLLSNMGRVLLDVVSHPGSVVREVAVRVGISETQVTRHITYLWNNSLIEKRRFGGRFGYFCDLENLLNNGDIQLVLQAVIDASKAGSDKPYTAPDISA